MSTVIIRYLWAFPASAVGLLLACAARLLGASWRLHSGVLEVTLLPGRRARGLRWIRSVPFAAITFGHVVLAATDRDHATLRCHERVHVAQYERWGFFFLLAYPAESLLQLLRGGRPYLDNRFEVAARAGASSPRS